MNTDGRWRLAAAAFHVPPGRRCGPPQHWRAQRAIRRLDSGAGGPSRIEVIPPPKKGDSMFPEFRDLISKLKNADPHFSRLFEQHNELDHQIKRMESGVESAAHETIETLKKQKLRLKDEMYVILKKAEAAAKSA